MAKAFLGLSQASQGLLWASNGQACSSLGLAWTSQGLDKAFLGQAQTSKGLARDFKGLPWASWGQTLGPLPKSCNNQIWLILTILPRS